MSSHAALFAGARSMDKAFMSLVRNWSLQLAALCFLAVGQNGAFAECHAAIGAIPLVIPVPAEGFVDAGADHLKTMDVMVVGVNRLLCAFLTPDDYARMLDPKQETVMDRYMLVEVQKTSEDTEFTDEGLEGVRNTLRTQFSEILDKTTKPTQDEVNEKFKKLNSPQVKLDKPIPLGLFYSGPNAEAYGVVMDVNYAGGTSRRIAMSAMFLKIRSRLVFVYIYSVYKEPATIDWLKQMSEQWAKSILAANDK